MPINPDTLREVKELSLTSNDGVECNYLISKFKAIAGREIVTNYPTTAMPKVGEYKANEAIMLKLMQHVAVVSNGTTLVLENRELVDNHIPEWEILAKIEMSMLEYNCSFFQNGKISGFFDNIKATALQLITKISTDSSDQLLQQIKHHFESLQNTTH